MIDGSSLLDRDSFIFLTDGKGKKRTFPKHSAWGEELIKVLMFQPEQDRTNKSLQRSLLHLEAGVSLLCRVGLHP